MAWLSRWMTPGSPVTVTVSVPLADRERGVGADDLAGAQDDAVLLEGLEAGRGDLDAIASGAQVRDLVVAAAVALGGARHAGVLVGDQDRGAGDGLVAARRGPFRGSCPGWTARRRALSREARQQRDADQQRQRTGEPVRLEQGRP